MKNWKLLPFLLLILCLTSCSEKAFSEDPSAIEVASKSVVELNIYNRDDLLIASGSGFFAYDAKTIITNYHVIENAYRIEAVDDENAGFDVPIIINYDKETDLAILQIESSTGEHTPLLLGDSTQVRRGENVVAIGSPLGLKNTVSKGEISNFTEEDDISMIQFTAAISNGSSGGALLNDAGEVIGVTTGSYIDGQSLNLAIPASEIQALHEKANLSISVTEYYEKTVIPTIHSGILTVGTCPDFPPYEYIDNTGNFAGIEIEILEAIATELGLEVMFEAMPFEDLIGAAAVGAVDCVVGGMGYTSDRQKVVNVSNSMFEDSDGFNAVIYIGKQNIDLQSAINKTIVKLQDNGSIDAIRSKY